MFGIGKVNIVIIVLSKFEVLLALDCCHKRREKGQSFIFIFSRIDFIIFLRIKEQWVTLGPANKRCYDVLPFPEKDKALLKPASVDLVRSCVNFLTSGQS